MPAIKPDLFQILTKISEITTQHNRQAYVVGGFVRDWILGREISDVDIAIGGDALIIAHAVAESVGGKYVLLDEANGIYRVMTGGESEPRHLDFTTFLGTVEEDMARRDFAINAMAIELQSLVSGLPDLIDPFCGKADATGGLLRAVSQQIFEEDPSRLLRAVRLAAELNLKIEPDTERLISQNGKLIKLVAGEKLREEMLRLLAISDSAHLFYYLNDLDLLTNIIPEMAEMEGVSQPKEHYWNVFDHSLETVATVEYLLREREWAYGNRDILETAPWSEEMRQYFNQEVSCGSNRRIMLKLGGLLHDVAKPRARTVDETGKIRFIGHPKLGAAMVVTILNRLRFSSREINLAENLVYYHLRPAQMANIGLPTNRAIYRYFRDTEDAGTDILILALADYLATHGPKLSIDEWKVHNQLIMHIINEHHNQQTKVLPVKLIDGNELMETFDLTPGPLVGKLLSLVHEAHAAGEISTREEAIFLIRKEYKQGYCSGCCKMPLHIIHEIDVLACAGNVIGDN